MYAKIEIIQLAATLNVGANFACQPHIIRILTAAEEK
jgi:hypothetical protein